MENPLGDMPSLEPSNQPPKEETPIAIQEPAVEEKRPFFTVGKILAIFGVLLIVGTVVGAIMYSRSSERFQGAIITNRLEPIVPITEEPVESGTISLATNVSTLSTVDRITTTTSTTSVCDPDLNRVASTANITLAANFAPTCICMDGFVSLVANDKCVEIDYCAITEEQFSAYLNSNYVSEATKKEMTSTVGGSLVKYQEINCKEEPLTGITTLREPVTTLTFPKEEELVCTAPLVNQTDSATGAEYCMCPTQQYPSITLLGGLAAAPIPTTSCLPFSCDLTDEQEAKMYQDLNTTLTKQELSAAVITSITTKFKSDYAAYEEKYCPKDEVVTCEDLEKQLGAAYYAKNWEAYTSVLNQMEQLKCLEPCEMLFYRAVMQLSMGQMAEARKYIDQYIKQCVGVNECTLTYGMLSIYAQTLSELEQESLSLSALTAPKIDAEDLARLKELVTKYIQNCTCIEMDSFLIDPGFPAEDYFVQGTSAILDRSNLLNTSDRLDFSQSVNLSSDNTLRIAYAQSSVTLSPSVRGVIESVYNELCPEETPDEPGDEPESCKTLTITAPSSTGTYVMSRDFNPTTDYLKFKVDNDELVTGYKISSGTVTFDGDAKTVNVAKTKTEVSMSGGPAQGIEDVIRVVALEGGSVLATHAVAPKETCAAELKLTRPMDPPPTDEKKPEPEPVCRLLEITSPSEAARAGVPTIELASGTYTNKVLEIKVNADAGSVKDYKYASANGYIKFNGENPLYTTDKTVVMNGVIPEGETDTISVWARDPDLKGIQSCNDGYVITVPKEETPPPVEKTPPPVTTTEEVPPPPIEEIVIPTEPVPVVITTTPEPVHEAAPESPQTGPGMLIYLVGAGLGGALLRRKK